MTRIPKFKNQNIDGIESCELLEGKKDPSKKNFDCLFEQKLCNLLLQV